MLPSIRGQNELKKLDADIAAARKRRSITQARLAEGAGINVSTVRRLESGELACLWVCSARIRLARRG